MKPSITTTTPAVTTPLERALKSVDSEVWTFRPTQTVREVVEEAIKKTGRDKTWLICEAVRQAYQSK
jgi:hypothetical protein